MTQKELLYVEDAIGHENTIIEICKETINNLEDEDLKTFIDQQKQKHEDRKQNLMSLLEGKND